MGKIFIIGAGRSGTNMLRDALCMHDEISTWPCDEINYIWRYAIPPNHCDELDPINLSISQKKYIIKAFKKISNKNNTKYIVEKTCANSLRLNYVHKLFPNGKYILIIRDGRDVLASALKRWSAKVEFLYILKKIKFMPLRSIPDYAISYILNRLYKLNSEGNNLKKWGPIYNGMLDDIRNKDITYVATMQWMQCVKKSILELKNINDSNKYIIKYEKFVKNPDDHMQNIFKKFNIDYSEKLINRIGTSITSSSISKWRIDLSDSQIDIFNKLAGNFLNELDYK